MEFSDVLARLKPAELSTTESQRRSPSLYEALEEFYRLAEKVGKVGFRAAQGSEMISARIGDIGKVIEDQVAAREEDLRRERMRIGDLEGERDRVVQALVEVMDLASAAAGAVRRELGPEAGERFRLLQDQMVSSCERAGLSQTARVGQQHDPEFHEAIEEIETDQLPARSIAEVIRQGYRFHGKPVRIAKVTVSK